VTYILFPDEGHVIVRPENQIALCAAAEQLLAAWQGGRAEPIGAAMRVSTATVPHGAGFTLGLAESLAPE
jgi:hypothetical protein